MDELAAAEKAAKDAKRALVMTLLAVACAVVVLVIDQGIKRAVLDETVKARNILDEFRNVAKEARDGAGTAAAGDAGGAAVGGVGAGGDVVHDAAAGTVLDPAADGKHPAPPRGKAGVAGGAPGNGGRAGGAEPGKIPRRVPPKPAA